MMGDAVLTLWVTREAFRGDTSALAARETKAITAAKGTISENGPVMMTTAGTVDNKHAQRIVVHLADHYEMRVMTVHGTDAFIFHCETPDVPNAWINVGSDCMIRGTTFHVAPPPPKKN